MTVLAGVDLAWSGRKPTGICVVRLEPSGARLERLECLPNAGAEDVADVLNALGPDVVAAIDAPLIVGPARRAEAELARAFGSRGVYAYAARQDFLDRHGITEGPKLGELLRASGWSLDGTNPDGPGLHALEVFPHATTVSLLGADRALRYKKGPLAARLGPLAEFQARLRDYAAAHLPCLFDDPAGALVEPPALTSGRALKDLEDRLDAVACVLAAHHAHRFGSPGLLLFGDAENGYIAVPRPFEPTSAPAPSSP
ncbi:MAG: DUF429 domain-containing protein [Dehalococcoidia bacterium]|jgi:predicted RNase H-like nuclease